MVSISDSWCIQEKKDQTINPVSSSVLSSNESQQENPIGSEELYGKSPSESHVVLIHEPNTDQSI